METVKDILLDIAIYIMLIAHLSLLLRILVVFVIILIIRVRIYKKGYAAGLSTVLVREIRSIINKKDNKHEKKNV